MATSSSRENQSGGGGGGGDSSSNGVFSLVLNRHHHHPHHPHHRWRFFSVSSTRSSLWTKYCLLCTLSGFAATILAGIFLVVAALFRYYTTSIYYFETVPTYIPAILLSICGVSTIAFSCKRNRNIILLRITACWSLVSAALSSVITITTSLIHMNRLQTLRECVYNGGKPNPPSCTCLAHTLSIDSIGNDFEPVHYVFENTDCDVIHGILYSCLRAVFAISVVAVLLSIFLCMLLYQLIGHERKKAYWSRIRRINSDWSEDFIACLARPMPRERSNMPLIMSPSSSMPMSMSGPMMPIAWGPPPPYSPEDENMPTGSMANFVAIPPGLSPPPVNSHTHHHHHHKPSHVTFAGLPSLENIHNNNNNNNAPIPIISAHPFSPTITSVDPTFRNFTTSGNSTAHNNNNHHSNLSSSAHPSQSQSQRNHHSVHNVNNNSSSSHTESLSMISQEQNNQNTFYQQQQQMTLPRTFSTSPPKKGEASAVAAAAAAQRHVNKKRLRSSDGSIFSNNFDNFRNSSETDIRVMMMRDENNHTRDFIPAIDYDNDEKFTTGIGGDLEPGSPLLVRGGTTRASSGGGSSSSRIARNFRMDRISLPNSPILMNVRRFCNFRLSESSRDHDHAKTSTSATKLSTPNVSTVEEQNRSVNQSIETLQSINQAISYHFQNENYVHEEQEKNFSLSDTTTTATEDEINKKKPEGGEGENDM